MNSRRDRLIVHYMVHHRLTHEQAVAMADNDLNTNAPKRVVEHSAEIVDSVVEPVAEAAQGISNVVTKGIRGLFGKG